jgi:hypothetical protein
VLDQLSDSQFPALGLSYVRGIIPEPCLGERSRSCFTSFQWGRGPDSDQLLATELAPLGLDPQSEAGEVYTQIV